MTIAWASPEVVDELRTRGAAAGYPSLALNQAEALGAGEAAWTGFLGGLTAAQADLLSAALAAIEGRAA